MLPDIKELIKLVYNNKCNIYAVPCYEPYMTFIEEGKKTIEGRVGTQYYTKIRSGDVVCLHNRTKEIWCEIIRTQLYPTFKDMLEQEGLKKMLPQAGSIEAGVQIYRKFPTFAEKELKFGAYAMEVKFINIKELKQHASIPSNAKRSREQLNTQTNATSLNNPQAIANPAKKMKVHPLL